MQGIYVPMPVSVFTVWLVNIPEFYSEKENNSKVYIVFFSISRV